MLRTLDYDNAHKLVDAIYPMVYWRGWDLYYMYRDFRGDMIYRRIEVDEAGRWEVPDQFLTYLTS